MKASHGNLGGWIQGEQGEALQGTEAAEGVEDHDDDDEDGGHDPSIHEEGDSKQEANRFSISSLLYPILFWQTSKKKTPKVCLMNGLVKVRSL